jgi:hypothetical protein
MLGFVLGTIGKGVLKRAFENSVKAIELRNSPGADERPDEPIRGKRFAAATFSSKAAVLNREQSTKLQTVA